MVSVNEIKDSIKDIVSKYPIKKVSLFGSYAENTTTNDSDIDLLIEFLSSNISLFMLYDIKNQIEDRLQKKVNLIHAPIEEGSLILMNNREYLVINKILSQIDIIEELTEGFVRYRKF